MAQDGQSFVEKTGGSAGVSWGKLAAGAGIAGGVVLVGAGASALNIPIVGDIADSVKELVETMLPDSAEQATDAAVDKVAQAPEITEAVATTPPELSVDEQIEQILEANRIIPTDDLRQAIAEAAAQKEPFNVVAQNIGEQLARVVGGEVDIAKTAADLASAASDKMDAVTAAYEQGNIETQNKMLEALKGEVALQAPLLAEEAVSEAPKATDAVLNGASKAVEAPEEASKLVKYGALPAGAALTAGGLTYLNNKSHETPEYAKLDKSRLENVQMGFAAKEKMRAVNALMEARMAVFNGQNQGQGIA